MEVLYTDLVNDPKNITMEICHFLDIPFENSMLEDENDVNKLGDVGMREHHANVMKPIDASNIGKGKASLSDEDVKIIREVVSVSKYKRVRAYIEGNH